jgi:hypothetical protein
MCSIFAAMGKNRKYEYRPVTELPDNAMTVAQYASEVKDCNTSYIYELIRKAKNTDFEIVIFKGINFVVPLTNN